MACLDEETATAFAEGRLAPGAVTEVEDHSSTCALCRGLVAAALGTRSRASAPSDPAHAAHGGTLPRGTTFGRYTLLGLRGRGATGEVHAAYDSALDRRVAIKLLHARARAHDPRYEARLLREARAMAKVSHPNVVAVHDVGTFEGRVFVAMDFVDGVTLDEWLAAAPRRRDEIVATYIMAARGLAAAHDAGLVHRDFKPQNVMVAADGTARVMDFGLVSSLGGAGKELDAPLPMDPSAQADVHLTRTGELVGTPLYMAPEQFRGAPSGPATDQFAFCVALHQSLTGASPFDDTSLRTLMPAVLAGKRRPPPPGATVPAWLRQALDRGLNVDPAARWPTMRTLIAALERDPARGRRRRALLVGGALAAASSGLALARHAIQPSTLCQGGPAAIASAWPDPARRDAVRTAFMKTGAPSVDEVWQRVTGGLNRYVDGWLETYRQACEATQLRHEQPAAVLDVRMACLGERRIALAALTEVLASADREIVDRAVDAVRALPPLERCSDLQQLQDPVEPPRDAATRTRVEELRKRLAHAKALTDAGKHDEGVRLARKLAGETRALAFEPLVVEGLATLTRNYNFFRTPIEAADVQPIREETVWRSLGLGRTDLAADEAIVIFSDLENVLLRKDRAAFWRALASALVERLGSRGERQLSWILQGEANTRLAEGNAAEALALARRAAALKQKVLGPDDPDIATSLVSEANALDALGRPAEALAINDRAYTLFAHAYGERSRAAAEALSNRGENLLALGRPSDALQSLRAGLAGMEAHLGPTSSDLGFPLTALGRAELALGRPTDAVRYLERALRLREAGEPNERLVAETREALSRARKVLAQ